MVLLKRYLNNEVVNVGKCEEYCTDTESLSDEEWGTMSSTSIRRMKCRTVLTPSTNEIEFNEMDIESINERNKSFKSIYLNPSHRLSIMSSSSLKPSNLAPLRSTSKAGQLFVGAMGIYAAYLYYGHLQEDLFRYRNDSGEGFRYVWFLQVMESAVTAIIGYLGRHRDTTNNTFENSDPPKKWPVLSFWKSGVSQLAAKALMSLSLAAGLSFPVVVLAKSAKIVPVMVGQLVMGGSNYKMRDYLFAALIVSGTAMLSCGSEQKGDSGTGKNTATGFVLILLSLAADGFTGGLQKKLKLETAELNPTAFDFLYFSHCAQFTAALLICICTGELWTAPVFLQANPAVWFLVIASSACSAVGQCFIFYVIACFDPLVCTTITTTRKMLSVLISITFKGHDVNMQGAFGLALGCIALLVEVEGKISNFFGFYQNKISAQSSTALSTRRQNPVN